MFKRRLAVLGTVAVLAVTGLAGSAMADEPTPAPGAKVTCTTADGKVVELAQALPAKKGFVAGPDGKVTRLDENGAVKVERLPDGGVAVKRAEPLSPEEIEKLSKVKELPPEAAEKLAKLKELSPEEAEKLSSDDFLKAVPATPALPAEGVEGVEGADRAEGVTPPEGGPAETVKIICKKPEE
ncbi:hypothetical protein HD597_010203 [Nonomuraea thailandensis]|uniref:Uncharacterized protein n=1 Tax=Nonomuraea thailandensis TaxID=1188745 RepID=A0A9X2GYC2_9ACTN|nr:hypothetical protein [Nonomuraea thailandensis]MCP2363183.1 hypothetical protein [Nonomuraea thailandensis]